VGSQEKYLKPDVIQQVKRLDLRAKFIVEGFLVGLQKSPFFGFSAEFSEHQKYEPGDDISRIDWSVYARTDRYYTKRFQAETNLTAMLLIDLSRSMDYPPPELRDHAQLTKFEYAVSLAAALTYMMIHQSDSVGMATFDSVVRTNLPPKSRRTQLGAIIGSLAAATPTGQTNLPRALEEAAGLMKHRGLIILFSDLLPSETGEGDFDDEIAAVMRALHLLKHRGNDVILFHILDQSEVEFAFKGTTKFLGVETPMEMPATDARALRSAYLEELASFRDRYKRESQKAGIDFVPLHTGMPFDKALITYLMERKSRF
jgi:uncharacterized protein (DUF58 family)